jgi:hypothetical protein
MNRTATIILAVVVAFLAGREANIAEMRYAAATARPLFRVHANHVTWRDGFGRPIEILCPRCLGYPTGNVQTHLPDPDRCTLCAGTGRVKVDQTGLDIRQVEDSDPMDYPRQPRR